MSRGKNNIINRRFLSMKYDELYKKMEGIIFDTNLCKIKGATIEACASCTIIRPPLTNKGKLCCDKIFDAPPCIHHSPQIGCKVKSLRCKAWLCQEVYSLNVSPDFQKSVAMSTHIKGKRVGYSFFPILNFEHKKVLEEILYWKFDLLFREGKTEAILAALSYFKKNPEEAKEKIKSYKNSSSSKKTKGNKR